MTIGSNYTNECSFFFFLLCVWMPYLHIHLYTVCVHDAQGSEKRASDPLRMESYIVASHNGGSGNQIMAFCNNSQCFEWPFSLANTSFIHGEAQIQWTLVNRETPSCPKCWEEVSMAYSVITGISLPSFLSSPWCSGNIKRHGSGETTLKWFFLVVTGLLPIWSLDTFFYLLAQDL